MESSRLFLPVLVGKTPLEHRIAMAPLTRLRATEDRVPTTLMKEYYRQRAASVPGTLIISEGIAVSLAAAHGFPRGPGIWSDEQVAAWKPITDEVHRHGGFIYAQIFAMGRAVSQATAQQEGAKIVGPSAIPIDDSGSYATPVAMTLDEIQQSVSEFAAAARNAIVAGFDGVEVHGASGYLIDQFSQSNSNQRTDRYGGSVENRSLFLLEVLQAVVDAIGADRVGLRLSPCATFQGMRMEDPVSQFSHIIKAASAFDLAFLHLLEPRISGASEAENELGQDSLDFAYPLWKGVMLVAGGYSAAEAKKLVDEKHPDRNVIVVFGRYFISNPDLVYRIREDIPLAPYNRGLFYTHGTKGYTDYAYSEGYLSSKKHARVAFDSNLHL